MRSRPGWLAEGLTKIFVALSERGYLFDAFIPQGSEGTTVWFLVGNKDGKLVPTSVWVRTPEEFVEKLKTTNFGLPVDV